MLLPALLFVILRRGRNVDLGGSLWWFVYLAGLSLIAWLGTPTARPFLPPLHQLAVAALFALAVFPLAVRSRLLDPSPYAMLDLDAPLSPCP